MSLRYHHRMWLQKTIIINKFVHIPYHNVTLLVIWSEHLRSVFTNHDKALYKSTFTLPYLYFVGRVINWVPGTRVVPKKNYPMPGSLLPEIIPEVTAQMAICC